MIHLRVDLNWWIPSQRASNAGNHSHVVISSWHLAQDSMAHPDRWILSQRASNAATISMSPHHHGPPPSSMDSPHKGPVMPQSLPCPHTIMAYHRALWSCQWGLMAASWWGGVGISQVGIYHCRVVGVCGGSRHTSWTCWDNLALSSSGCGAVEGWTTARTPAGMGGYYCVCIYHMDTLLVF